MEIRRALMLSVTFCGVVSSHCALNFMNYCTVSNELYRRIMGIY